MLVQTCRSGIAALGGPDAPEAHFNSSWKASVVAELAEVVRNDVVTAQYRHLVVNCSAEASAAAPGQFFQLLCPPQGEDQPFLRRPMSLYRANRGQHQIEFLYKVTGAGTRGLARLHEGDRLDIMGPLGVGFVLDPAWNHVVLVGRGAGLATLAPLGDVAAEYGIGVTAILSAKSPDLLVSVDRFRSQGADVIKVSDTEGTSGPSEMELLLRRLVAESRCDVFFTCGSARLLRIQQRLADEFGMPGQVAMEQQMACGIGLCHACVRDFDIGGDIVSQRVCWDGPVFDLKVALP